MTEKQLCKYRAEWSRAWRALRAAGHHADEKADDVRKRWHLYIGAVCLRGPDAGQPKSSLVLNNAEFDRFLKRCAAAHSDDDLMRQLDLDAQPMLRLRHATDPIFDLMAFDQGGPAREAYLRGIYANLQRPAANSGQRVFAIEEMPGDEDLQAIVIALTHTAAHKLGKAHGHPRTEHVSGSRARNEFTHRVGNKSRTSTQQESRVNSCRLVSTHVDTGDDDGDPF